MNPAFSTAAKAGKSRAIATTDEAKVLVERLISTTDELLVMIEQESNLVRAAKLAESSILVTSKNELANRYLIDAMRVRENATFLSQHVPELYRQLRRQHENFQDVLQTNLTVLATAHAVSEGIIRGVAQEITRKASPQTYGRSGRTILPRPNTSQPVAVSRSL